MKKCETKTEKHYERGGYKHKQGQIKLLHFAKELARLFDPLILLILFSFFLFVFHELKSWKTKRVYIPCIYAVV
jgi:hypothetical protein